MTSGETGLTMLGHYQVAELLGAGGMGEVYLAHSPSGRAVAVKVIREDLAAKPGFRERFAREVQAARQVSGAFTAPVLDADTTGPTPWMATQYVDGPTLAEVVAQRGPLPADDVWRLASGLCEALRDIHRAGLVHRDLKPGNILLADDGPRVIDFGISRVVDATALTQSGQILGTPLFMAPEQFRTPRDAGPAADVFALGSVLVYAATGHGPFDADTPYAIAWNAVHEAPDLTGLPDSLHPVVTPCLHKDPTARPTPTDLLTLLSSRRHRRTTARATALAHTRRTRLRHTTLALAALTSAALALGIWTWLPGANTDGKPHKPLATATGPRSTPTPVRLPGWKPWTAQLVSDGFTSPEQMLDCHYNASALWCTGENILAARLDPLTGKVLWQQQAPARLGTPWISTTHQTVYTGAYEGDGLNSSYRFWAFDAATGKQLTERLVPGAGACTMAVETLVCDQDGGIKAWAPTDMSPMWTAAQGWQPFSLPGGNNPDWIHAEVLGPHGATEVGAINQGSGTFEWRRKIPQGYEVVTISGEGSVYLASPAASRATKLMRMDRRTGARKPLALAAPEQVLGIAGDVSYSHRAGVISAYDLSAGRLLWSSTTLHEAFSAPAVAGDRVHFTTEDGTVIALDRKSGSALWQHRPPKGDHDIERSGPPGGRIPSPVVMGDVIIASVPESRIHSFLAPTPGTTPPGG
ncbi:protein kinase domain-containing protein [Streptomyces wedmorensis]|uniref:serine/threonine-protein kinase n=1 Tax=Streptomyces wedmorensis TaxID=43759 RepID=UPI00378E39B8